MNCTNCPRHCFIPLGKSGFCGVRRNMKLDTENVSRIFSIAHGKNTGLAVDPIEKKPLYHFYPNSKTLSLGSIGCNLDCKFCQNFSIAHSVDDSTLIEMPPSAIVDTALRNGCQSIAFTYNEPIIWLEYAIEIAIIAHQAGLFTIAVTNGYISPEVRQKFFDHIDAANVDLKSFSDKFYREYCSAAVEPVKETLCYLAEKNKNQIKFNCNNNSIYRTWLEITTLLIPGLNDSEDEIEKLSEWIFSNLGSEIPLHFSAFRPADRMQSIPPTPSSTLFRSRDIASSKGLKYVYTGNIDDPIGQATFCPQCKQNIISRNRFNVTEYLINEDQCCNYCGQTIAGEFVTDY